MTDDRISGWQVRPDQFTGYCKLCGALLADIQAHLDWHDARGSEEDRT